MNYENNKKDDGYQDLRWYSSKSVQKKLFPPSIFQDARCAGGGR